MLVAIGFVRRYKVHISRWLRHLLSHLMEVIGKYEFHIDEAQITEVTELPSRGEKWFNTTIQNMWSSDLT